MGKIRVGGEYFIVIRKPERFACWCLRKVGHQTRLEQKSVKRDLDKTQTQTTATFVYDNVETVVRYILHVSRVHDSILRNLKS